MKNCKHGNFPITCAICHYEDEIAALRARVARLEEALKPFADEACGYDPDEGDDGLFAFDTTIKIGQLRAALRALEEKWANKN